ncbi:MAG: CotH kinase family protein [Bacteroidia bacterium]
MKRISTFLTFLLFSYTSIFAQVYINEYSCSNKTTITDNYGENEDWIELYNAGATAVNLGGYFLSDKPTDPTKWMIPAGLTLNAGARKLIWASGLDIVVGTNYHANFKLTQMRQESIILADASGTIIDQVALIPTLRNHSRGRVTDGAATFGVFTTPTPNAANANAFQEYVEKPVFNLAGGYYNGAQSITITCATPGAEIRYTLNGTMPTAASTLYAGAINIIQDSCIRAIALIPGSTTLAPSFSETNTYLIDKTYTLPLVCVAGTFTGGGGLFNTGNEIMNSFEYYDENHVFQMEMDGDMRRHGNDSWAYSQKGMRFYARDQYGKENNMAYNFFPNQTTRDEYDVIILKAAGSDNFPDGGSNPPTRCAHIRDAFVQSVSDRYNLQIDSRKVRSCLVYVNGRYWGVYELRERIDADYTEYYYNQGENDIDMLRFWGGLNVEYGSDSGWVNLYNFATTQNLAVPANYAHVEDRLDLIGLIDYFVLNTYVNNSDWLNWNSSWWRGRKQTANTPKVKWKYQNWDVDNCYNLGQNYTGLPSTNFTNDPCEVTDLPQFQNAGSDMGHVDIFNALMVNPVFRDLYINRYSELINTAFNCVTMLAHFDSMVAHIDPEMNKHCTRWGGTYTQWQNNIVYLRNQISGRCAVIDTGMIDCFNVTGPYNVTMSVAPVGSGTIQVSTQNPTSYPFTTDFFGGVNIPFIATPNPGYIFDYWEVLNHAPSPNINSDSMALNLIEADTVIAHFKTQWQASNDTTLCGSSTVTLKAQGVPGATYAWNIQGNATVISTDSFIVVTPATTTSYVVSSGINIDTITITVNAIPTFSFGTDKALCDVPSITLNPNLVSIPTVVYQWQDATSNPTYTITQSGQYWLFADNNGCTHRDTINVVLGTTPSFDFGNPNQLFCDVPNILLNPNIPANPLTILTWQDGSGAPTYNVTTSGLYWLSATNQGCTHRDSVSYILSTTPVVNLGADSTYCSSNVNSVLLDATNAGNTHIYTWQDGSANPTFLVTSSGLYYVHIDNQGCTASDSVAIVLGPPPAVELGATKQTLCPNEPLELNAEGSQLTYEWQDGSTYTTYFVKSAGLYYVTVTNAQGCQGMDSVEVEASPLFSVDLGPDRTICYGDSINLAPQLPAGANIQWVGYSTRNLLITSPGVYTANVVLEGCRVEDQIEFKSIDCQNCDLYVPSAFTPNGDNYNDGIYCVANCPIATFSWKIFDRWGTIVYETNDIAGVWGGKDRKGKDVPEGVYQYFAKCNVSDEGKNKEIIKTGTITVVR